MKSKEIFSSEQMESLSKGKEQEKSFIPRARLVLLREIIKRLKEIKGDVPLERDETRQHVETYIEERYNRSKTWQMNLAVRREALMDLLELLYSRPKRDETPEEAKAKLQAIQERVASCPPESVDDLIGVYLRIKNREEDTQKKQGSV